MESINIEKIMEEIRRDIKERGLVEDALDFTSAANTDNVPQTQFRLAVLEDQIHFANLNADISRHVVIEGNAFIRFIKKVIRKCTRFYIQPIIDAQNAYNANSVRSLNELLQYVREQQEYIQTQNTMMEKMIHEINVLSSK